jgi:hypothetical protein
VSKMASPDIKILFVFPPRWNLNVENMPFSCSGYQFSANDFNIDEYLMNKLKVDGLY